MFEKIFAFFQEVRLEAKKVNWPTLQETIRNTVIVIAFSASIAALLGFFDFVFTSFLKRFIS